MGRPPLAPELRKPRVSGKPRAPTEGESAHQRALLRSLAEELGEALWRAGETPREAAPWARLGALAGHASGDTVRRASLPPSSPRAIYVRPETLAAWAAAIRTAIEQLQAASPKK